MNRLLNHFKNPAPLFDKAWQTVLLCSIVVALVLAIFEPFAFKLNNLWQFLMLMGFVLLVFLTSTLFFVLIPRFFHSYFNSERWTNGRMYIHLLSFFLFTGIVVFIYEYVWLGRHSYDEYWNSTFFTILAIDILASTTIGLIPIIISIYMTKNRRLKENLLEANNLNHNLSQRLVQYEIDDKIVLESSTKESFCGSLDSILYIESEGNYVHIVFHEDNMVKKKMLRSTIKQIEEQLNRYDILIRCHRAFIINMNHILKVSGNAQGYKLYLRHIQEAIPVSRTYTTSLKESL